MYELFRIIQEYNFTFNLKRLIFYFIIDNNKTLKQLIRFSISLAKRLG